MTKISLADDADLLTPREMSAKLAALTEADDVIADYYGGGGAVEAFEAKMAELLGKEHAVMFPTGTLANLCAMRLLAGPDHARILVHRDSHMFNDSGDNLAALGRYTMVPLGQQEANYDASDVRAEIARAADARVATKIGCVAIESPSRRGNGRRFGAQRIAAIAEVAREQNVPMFLDGARMLIECAISGMPPAEMAAPFDLTYVSLYKYLDAPFGCVLAGDAALLQDVFHDRRRYGGGMWQMWPAAVLASAKIDQLDALWSEIVAHADAVFSLLDGSGVQITPYENGTNAVCLELPKVPEDPSAFKARALELGLKVPPITNNKLVIKMNESWLKIPPAELASKIRELAA